MNRILMVLGVVLFIVVYSSCDEPERTVLTKAERELLDSLYARQVPYARKSADSLCDVIYQDVFDRAADSIKQIYIEEIQEIVEGEG